MSNSWSTCAPQNQSRGVKHHLSSLKTILSSVMIFNTMMEVSASDPKSKQTQISFYKAPLQIELNHSWTHKVIQRRQPRLKFRRAWALNLSSDLWIVAPRRYKTNNSLRRERKVTGCPWICKSHLYFRIHPRVSSCKATRRNCRGIAVKSYSPCKTKPTNLGEICWISERLPRYRFNKMLCQRGLPTIIRTFK